MLHALKGASPGAGPSLVTQKDLAEAIIFNVHILASELQNALAPAQLKRPQAPSLLEAMVVVEFFEKLLISFSRLFSQYWYMASLLMCPVNSGGSDLFELCLTCLSPVFSRLPVPGDGKQHASKIHGVGSMYD